MRIVIALGGNALGNNPSEQLKLIELAAKSIVELVAEGHEVILSHGNGPQVGMIKNTFEKAREIDKNIPDMPFAELNAMSQGYIGFHLQNKIREELANKNIEKPVVSIITQVVVDENDEAFNNPTKPIGSFYSKEESKIISDKMGYEFIEDSGRGYRRVIASPNPKEVIEIEPIKALIKSGSIVITVGGGGIPVYRKDNILLGIDAVIDKDFASSILADQIDADYLIILTAVDRVAINFGKENEKWLSEMNIENLDNYILQGHFAPGSMLPKVEAAKKFVANKKERLALITSLEKVIDGLNKKTGTIISQ